MIVRERVREREKFGERSGGTSQNGMRFLGMGVVVEGESMWADSV